ncbi:hypothetical protein AGOR_G00209010 [Albula goreensis]|uniref:PDZ domain-containing protein n=1 Tax=Albula goreensis TaxID=1534307 RepID=A0A8T3CTV3_9TELE|nr:hypothetical protein AGOR_G00209010 [Albula goreensis]
MDLPVESSLQLEPSESPCTSPNAGDGHAPLSPVNTEQRSSTARFNIRPAKDRTPSQSSEKKPTNLREIKSVFEAKGAGTAYEGDVHSQANCQKGVPGSPVHRASIFINKDGPDIKIKPKTETWSVRPKSPNQDKITGVPQVLVDQMRQNGCTSRVKPELRHSGSQGDQLEQETGGRGRTEWRRVNFTNRSKSLDLRAGMPSKDREGKPGVHGLRENRVGMLPRRTERVEREGLNLEDRSGIVATSMTKKVDQSCKNASSRIEEYSTRQRGEQKNHTANLINPTTNIKGNRPLIFAVERTSRGQSLPTRMKPRLSESGAEGDTSIWGLYQNGMRRAGDASPTQTISDRIEKLLGSAMSDSSSKHDASLGDLARAKRNSAPIGDWPVYGWQGVKQGGTFPRRFSSTERNYGETGNEEISHENEGHHVSTLMSSRVDRGQSVWGTQQNTQTSMTAREGSGSHQPTMVGTGTRSLDRSRNRQPFSVQPRPMISTPMATAPLQTPQSLPDSSPASNRDGPLSLQARAVANVTGEKERDCKQVKGDDKEPDLEAGKEEEGNLMQHDGGICDRKAEGKLGKLQEKQESSTENKEPKPLKAMTIRERSPTLKFCGALDWYAESLPKKNVASTSQAACTALGGVNKASKQVLTDHPRARPEQPVLQSSEPSKGRGDKERGKEEEEDVFRIKGTLRSRENKPDGEHKTGVISSSSSVRNKIHRFESLSQQSQTMPPSHLLRSRRAFSVPSQPKQELGVKKSESDKALGGARGRGPGDIWEEVGSKEEGWKRSWESRSASVDEMVQRRGGSGREIVDSVIEFKQTKQSAHKEPQCNLPVNIEPQRESKAFSDEPDSSNAGQSETKSTSGFRGWISKPVFTKDLANLQTNCNNNNGVCRTTGIENVSGGNSHDAVNKSEIIKEDTTGDNISIRSPFQPNNWNYGSPDNMCPDPALYQGAQASTSTPSSMGAALPLAAKSPINRTIGIPNASSTPSSKSVPRPFVSLSATGPTSTDPSCYGGVTPQSQATDPKGSFNACLVRWSSEEESDDDDDDDDEGTEKGSNYDSDSAESSVTITSNMSQSDRLSFSVSLADLCHFGGVDFTGDFNDTDSDWDDRMSHRTASLSSDVSALSCVSILPTDELDRLLEDVRGLGDETLQNYEDVQVVVLHKEVGCGLGFTVAGGVDQNKPITVHKVFPLGLASQEGSIREGDQVLSINGTALKNCAHWEALRTLRRARSRSMAVVVLQKRGAAKMQKEDANSPQVVLDHCTVPKGRTLQVVLKKSSTDLGFSLEGGVGSTEGDKPIIVKKLFQGGPVHDVCPGDELLEIEGQSLHGLRRLEVWNLIKKLPPGPVQVLLHRPFRPE